MSLQDPRGELEPLETPCLIVPTTMGLIPFVTPDNSGRTPLYFPITDLFNSTLPKNVKATTSLGLGDRWTFMGCSTEFFNFDEGPSKNGIRLYCRNGSNLLISKEQYMESVEIYKPNGVVSVHSHPLLGSSARQQKLRSASTNEGVYNHSHVINFTHMIASSKQNGLFAQYGCFTDEDAEKAKVDISERPKDVPNMIYFDGHPTEIKRALSAGFDLYILRFPGYYTEHGSALVFSFENEDFELGLELLSKEFEKDHRPIVEGCDCYCCINHTRSYVHHLLNVHEMLAKTLIIKHNIRHYERYFSYLRNKLLSK